MITAAVLAVLLSSSAAPAEPRLTVMGNGLTVITQELHYAPVAACVIAYGVGARNESDGIRGISHFCEHMMFKGTPGMPKGRFWQIVQRDGGWANAFTSNDLTAYFIMLPASRLVDALAIESDRMVNCLFDSAEVVSERNVVAEEYRMSSLDDPDGALYTALMETAYTVHPYRHPVIGYEDDILSYTAGSASEYYRRFYGPSNAVLCLVGDFETERVLALVDSCFGGIPAGSPAPEVGLTEPAQTAMRRVEIEHESNLARIAVGFHIPDGYDQDATRMEMISTLLSGGRSSRLEQSLVQTGLAGEAYAWTDAGMDDGLFVIGATVMPGVETGDVERVIWEEVARLASEDVSEDELGSLRRRARADLVMRSASPLGLAMNYALDRVSHGDHLASARSLGIIESTGPDDLAAAASEWLVPSNATVAILSPTGGMPTGPSQGRTGQDADMEAPSAIDYEGLEIPAELLTPPEASISIGVRERVLDNGLRVLVREDHTFPVVSVGFGVPLAQLREDPMLAGLAQVTIGAMLHGTEELGYSEFNARLEDLGSEIRLRAGMEFSTGSVRVLSEDLDTALLSVADLLIRPALRAGDVEQVVEEAIAEVEARNGSNFARASIELSRLMVADPAEARAPTTETLSRITAADVRGFHAHGCRPGGTVVAIVGDVDADETLERMEQLFGQWPEPAGPLSPAVWPEFSTAPGDTVVTTMPGRFQTAVYAAVPGPGYDSPDYIAFTTMNGILGSGIGSRLGHWVRDDQGLAYAVFSYLMAGEGRGVWLAGLSTRNDLAVRAAESVRSECARMTVEEVAPIELALEQSSSAAGHALSFTGYQDQSDYLVSTTMRGLPLEWDRTSVEATLSLSPSDIREAAERYLATGSWFWSFAGGVEEPLDPSR